MNCGTLLTTYACSNATGTTCTKVAVKVVNINANTVCLPGELVVMSGTEYSDLFNTIAAAETNSVGANDTAVTVSNQFDQILTALTAAAGGGGGTSAPNPDVIEAEGLIFGATLVALCSIYGLKYIYRLFTGGMSNHE